MSFELLDQNDPWTQERRLFDRLASASDELAGVPIPLDGERLMIEPSFPHAKEIEQIGQPETEDSRLPPNIRFRNSFWLTSKRFEVMIWQDTSTGKIEWGVASKVNHLDKDLRTIGMSVVWGIEQEYRALRLLAKHLRHYSFKCYLLTGSFLEHSPRSGIYYVFRRLRPTLAIAGYQGHLRIIAALCLHPIAYYGNSWAGVMCPTDDIIAHLMLMRACEHRYWRWANQHPPWRPEAGL